MPGSDAADSPETPVGLSWETSDSKSFDDSGVTFTSGDSNDITHFLLLENLVNLDFLLEFISNELDFVGS